MSLVEDIIYASLQSQRLIKEAELANTTHDALGREAALAEIIRQIHEIERKHNL